MRPGRVAEGLSSFSTTWGAEDTIRDRIDAHLKAGASHVCILPLRADGAPQPDLRAVQAFAQR